MRRYSSINNLDAETISIVNVVVRSVGGTSSSGTRVGVECWVTGRLSELNKGED